MDPPSTSVLLAPDTATHPDLLSAAWLSALTEDDSNHDVLSDLDTLAATIWTPNRNFPQFNKMSSAPEHISAQSSEFSMSSGHSMTQTSEVPSSQSNDMRYNPAQMIHPSSIKEENTSTMSYVPVANQNITDSQKIPQVNEMGQTYTFNVSDYASFRYPMSQPQSGESVVTQQPRSSVGHPQLAPQPVRVPQPSHLISPLLAQSRPQLPSGLRNSNYLIHPIIARPSTQPKGNNEESKYSQEKTPVQDAHEQQTSPSASGNEGNPASSSQSDNTLQMQLNQLVQSTITDNFQYQYQGQHNGTPEDETSGHQHVKYESSVHDTASGQQQVKYESSNQQHVKYESSVHDTTPGQHEKQETPAHEAPSGQHLNYQTPTYETISSHQVKYEMPTHETTPGQQVKYEVPTHNETSGSQTIMGAPPTIYSTEFLLHGGHTAPAQPQPSITQPVCSQPSQSSSSESSDDDTDKLAIADVTSSESTSDDDSAHLRTSETQQDMTHSHPVNFWEQHVASARIAASGVAHPTPVRLSSGFPSMFPPTTFPWANTGIYPQAFQPTFSANLQTPRDEAKPLAVVDHHEPSTEQHPPASQPKESQQTPFNQSDSFSYFLGEFPKSLDNLSNLQSHSSASRSVPHSTPDVPPTNHSSNLPMCPTPDSKESATQGVNLFSHNSFMSPSFFTQHSIVRSGVNTQLPPVSSTPVVNHSPTSNDKVSDDDSAIDVNSGSSSTSPSSSINSRGSPELLALHLQNEDSNSSVSDTSLLRSRSNSVTSICDSSISSTASSNSSFSVPRGNKRSNPDPDIGNYKKKTRTSYTPGQLRALERVYMENPYPECDTIDRLARDLDIPEQRLRVWFQNKRARMRRQAKQNKQTAPHPPVNPYNAQPMSAIMSSANPYSFLPPNSMMAPGQPSQMMQRPYFPYPQGAPGPIMQHPVNVSSAPGLSQPPPPLMAQQAHALTPQQSQIQRLYSFIAHKQH